MRGVGRNCAIKTRLNYFPAGVAVVSQDYVSMLRKRLTVVNLETHKLRTSKDPKPGGAGSRTQEPGLR